MTFREVHDLAQLHARYPSACIFPHFDNSAFLTQRVDLTVFQNNFPARLDMWGHAKDIRGRTIFKFLSVEPWKEFQHLQLFTPEDVKTVSNVQAR